MKFSGKDMFEFNPDWVDAGDEDAMDVYVRDAEEEVNVQSVGSSMQELDIA